MPDESWPEPESLPGDERRGRPIPSRGVGFVDRNLLLSTRGTRRVWESRLGARHKRRQVRRPERKVNREKDVEECPPTCNCCQCQLEHTPEEQGGRNSERCGRYTTQQRSSFFFLLLGFSSSSLSHSYQLHFVASTAGFAVARPHIVCLASVSLVSPRYLLY